jgi:DnaJ family protein C protein 7
VLLLLLQRVTDWVSQCRELLEKRTSPEATKALELISNALHICPHSDSLKEMKADALLMVCISFSFGSFHELLRVPILQ